VTAYRLSCLGSLRIRLVEALTNDISYDDESEVEDRLPDAFGQDVFVLRRSNAQVRQFDQLGFPEDTCSTPTAVKRAFSKLIALWRIHTDCASCQRQHNQKG